MKTLQQVESTRRQYHADPKRRTVHRSSLLVPHIEGCRPVISFVNHFLLKRNYQNVACKISAIDAGGALMDSVTQPVAGARVHTIDLAGKFGGEARNFLIEFFCADNLFIPFPAVMINHCNEGFCNVVHAYNRILNDVFEGDEIEQKTVDEASIDVVSTPEAETFFVFSSGIADVDAELRVELMAGGTRHEKILPLRLARLSNRSIGLGELFPGLRISRGAVIKIRQPRQALFFGRLLAGVRLKSGAAFAANHSYYDSSSVREYWNNDSSRRTYPYFAGFRNVVRMYPIMSPGELELTVQCVDGGGAVRNFDAGILRSPSGEFVEIDVGALLRGAGIDGIASYFVMARAKSGGVPTRVTHQLVVSDGDGASPMEASLAVGLSNSEAFTPPNRRGYTWGQMVVGKDYSSNVTFVWDAPDGAGGDVAIELYSSQGKIAEFTRRLEPRGAVMLDQGALTPELRSGALDFVWFIAKSERSDLCAYSVHQNSRTRHCSGEHGF